MATRLGRTRLDEIATPEAQKAWLVSPASEMVTATRKFPELKDDKYDDRLAFLLSAPEWPFIRTFLRSYIADFIFEWAATEGKWWNATIRERGGFIRINMLAQEVLTLDFRILNGGHEPSALGNVWVDADQVDAAFRNGLRLPDPFKVEKGHAGKTVRQNRIQFTGASVKQVEDFFSSDWVLRAARSLNLDLMQGGALAFGWPKFHVPKLIDAVFADDEGERAREIGSAEMNAITEETEYERLVWLRKNRMRFSDPVRERWDRRCAVTGIEASRLLEACHIKPWNESNEGERLNPANGLYLSALVHAAFDAHLIGISPEGQVCFSARLAKSDRQKMLLSEGATIGVTKEHRPFLEYRYSKFLEATKL